MKAFQLPLPLFQSVVLLDQAEKTVKESRIMARKGRGARKSAPERVRRAG
jgi:hypothetical protein